MGEIATLSLGFAPPLSPHLTNNEGTLKLLCMLIILGPLGLAHREIQRLHLGVTQHLV